MIEYLAATSDTRINRIPIAASDIRINRVCDATRAFDAIGYLLQLSRIFEDDWQSEKILKIRVHEKSVKTLKVKCWY